MEAIRADGTGTECPCLFWSRRPCSRCRCCTVLISYLCCKPFREPLLPLSAHVGAQTVRSSRKGNGGVPVQRYPLGDPRPFGVRDSHIAESCRVQITVSCNHSQESARSIDKASRQPLLNAWRAAGEARRRYWSLIQVSSPTARLTNIIDFFNLILFLDLGSDPVCQW